MRWTDTKRRALVHLLLAIALTGCGFGTHSQPDLPSFHNRATVRNCKTRFEMRSAGYAMNGIRGEIENYPAAAQFSDNWIEVDWLVEPRALHARIRNRTDAAITIDSVAIGPDRQSATTSAMQLGPRSSEDIRLASLSEVEAYFHAERALGQITGTNQFQVELRMGVAGQNCTYTFQVAPAGGDRPGSHQE